MNPRKRIPATLTAILAILALTACGETPKGDVQGTVNNPDPGYVRWYELPDGSAAVRCFSDSGGASCDVGQIDPPDKQSTPTQQPRTAPTPSSNSSDVSERPPTDPNRPTIRPLSLIHI